MEDRVISDFEHSCRNLRMALNMSTTMGNRPFAMTYNGFVDGHGTAQALERVKELRRRAEPIQDAIRRIGAITFRRKK